MTKERIKKIIDLLAKLCKEIFGVNGEGGSEDEKK